MLLCWWRHRMTNALQRSRSECTLPQASKIHYMRYSKKIVIICQSYCSNRFFLISSISMPRLFSSAFLRICFALTSSQDWNRKGAKRRGRTMKSARVRPMPSASVSSWGSAKWWVVVVVVLVVVREAVRVECAPGGAKAIVWPRSHTQQTLFQIFVIIMVAA